MSSPRHSGTASIDRIWPPRIDFRRRHLFLRVRDQDRRAILEHAAQHRAARAHRLGAVAGGRVARALARGREREAIAVALAAQEDRDVARARQQLERRGHDRLDRLGRLEPRAHRVQRLVHAQRLARIVVQLVGDRRQIHDRARRDQLVAEIVGVLVADAHDDAHRIVRIAEQQHVAVDERDLPAGGGVDRDPAAFALDRRAVRRAQVAKHVVLADLRDLRVVARQVIVGDRDRAGGRTTDRGGPGDPMDPLRGAAAQDLQYDHDRA